MGLDMYLTKRTYIGNEYAKTEANPDGFRPFVPITPEMEALGIKAERIAYVDESVGYWRKANQIHAWFVENTANGVDTNGDHHYVERPQLVELRDTCQRVLDVVQTVPDMVTMGRRSNPETGTWDPIQEVGLQIANPEVIEELLPSREGFFFGSTEYDQWYLEDIKHTIEVLDTLLAEYPEGEYLEIYYHSSW